MNFLKRDENESSGIPELPNSTFPELPELPPLPQEEEELPEIKAELPPVRRTLDISEIRENRAQMLKKEPVFVKIDKFYEAVKKLAEIKVKIGEIDQSLEKLRAIKNKEDQELKAWESEVQSVKEKVSSIDASFSNKM
jgi:hypothetical protein